jgi:hypothetical protein
LNFDGLLGVICQKIVLFYEVVVGRNSLFRGLGWHPTVGLALREVDTSSLSRALNTSL